MTNILLLVLIKDDVTALKENKTAGDVSADPVFFCRGSTQLSRLTQGGQITRS